MLLRIKGLAGLAGVGFVGVLIGGRRRHGWLGALRPPRARAVGGALLCGLGGLAWFVIIALETQAHLSGNDRYLVLGDALVALCGAVGFGWLAIGIGWVCLEGWGRGSSAGGE